MSTPRATGRVRTLLAVPIVLLPPVLGAGVFAWQHHEHDRAEAAKQLDADAVRAATLEVQNWAAVDYRKLDSYFKLVEGGATGKFLQEFTQTEPTLREGLTKNKSVQVPTIPKNGAGLLERDGNNARVVVAFDAVVTNISTKGPQPRQYRMQVTLQKVGGRWLTDNLEFVG
jgi:Mce-associated membrane protein